MPAFIPQWPPSRDVFPKQALFQTDCTLQIAMWILTGIHHFIISNPSLLVARYSLSTQHSAPTIRLQTSPDRLSGNWTTFLKGAIHATWNYEAFEIYVLYKMQMKGRQDVIEDCEHGNKPRNHWVMT